MGIGAERVKVCGNNDPNTDKTIIYTDTGAVYSIGVSYHHFHAFPLIMWSNDDSIISTCKLTRFTSSLTPCKQSVLLDLGGEEEALPELHQSFEVTVAYLTIQSCFLWSNDFFCMGICLLYQVMAIRPGFKT